MQGRNGLFDPPAADVFGRFLPDHHPGLVNPRPQSGSMPLHPDLQREKDAAFVWWRKAGTGMKIQNSVCGKMRENPDFGVALGACVYKDGKHEVDFNVTRNLDAYVYVGFANPSIDLDKTWCRRDARDQCWYYFGAGLTNALRNGWDDVVSKEVGGPACKIPRMMSTDRVRAYLDMDAGEARFALFRPDEPGQWKEMPGKITGILSPVCAAACMQDRCSVSLGETSKMSAQELAKESVHPEEKVKRPKVDKYAHIQSKFLSDARLNPISNVLRQLGEEVRLRRRLDANPPPYVQLSTISLVEAEGAHDTQALAHPASTPHAHDPGGSQLLQLSGNMTGIVGGAPCRPRSATAYMRQPSGVRTRGSAASAAVTAADLLERLGSHAHRAREGAGWGAVDAGLVRARVRPSSGVQYTHSEVSVPQQRDGSQQRRLSPAMLAHAAQDRLAPRPLAETAGGGAFPVRQMPASPRRELGRTPRRQREVVRAGVGDAELAAVKRAVDARLSWEGTRGDEHMVAPIAGRTPGGWQSYDELRWHRAREERGRLSQSASCKMRAVATQVGSCSLRAQAMPLSVSAHQRDGVGSVLRCVSAAAATERSHPIAQNVVHNSVNLEGSAIARHSQTVQTRSHGKFVGAANTPGHGHIPLIFRPLSSLGPNDLNSGQAGLPRQALGYASGPGLSNGVGMRGSKAPQDTWPRPDEGLHQAGSLVQAAQDGVVDHGKTAAVAKPSNSSGVKRRMHIPGNASGMQRVGVSDQTVRAGPEKERKRVADKLDRNRLSAPQPTKSAPTGSGQAVRVSLGLNSPSHPRHGGVDTGNRSVVPARVAIHYTGPASKHKAGEHVSLLGCPRNQ